MLILTGPELNERTNVVTKGIRISGVTEYRARRRTYSALMLAARITLPHFSVSSAMSLPKSAGEPGRAVPLKSAIRALILGSTRAALISLLRLSMISLDVFFGTAMPVQ